LVTSVAVVIVVLVAGIVVSTIFAVGQARARAEAERQAKISQAVNDFFNYDLLGSVLPYSSKGREMTLRSMLDEASKNIEGRFENEPLIEASIRAMLGNIYWFLRNGEAAELHLERALAIRREQLGYEHQDTQDSMDDLAWIYIDAFPPQKQYEDKAERLWAKLLETRRRTLGAEHPGTLFFMEALASLYLRQGRYKEAESLFLKVQEIYHRRGGEAPDFLSGLGGLYKAQGRYEEAEPLYLNALENVRRAWGADHPDALWIMGHLADIYARWGRLEEAEQLHVKVLELRRAQGEQHPFTVVLMSNAARFYQSQGRYNEAEQLFLRALEISRVMFGEAHPSTVDVIHALAGLYDAWGKPQEAEQWRAKLPSEKKVEAEETDDGGEKIEDSNE
jgi:tetratricopeptide (TPR) repeat protein